MTRSEPLLYDELAAVKEGYRLLAYAYCRLINIDPEEIISDGGHEAWMLAAYDAVQKERKK